MRFCVIDLNFQLNILQNKYIRKMEVVFLTIFIFHQDIVLSDKISCKIFLVINLHKTKQR